MIIAGTIIAGIFGLLLGSFLNVVIVRHNTGYGLGGRSMCFSCMKSLSWYELIPFISFVIQRGRCRSCKSHIPWQDFIVETSSGLLLAGTFLFWSDNVMASPLFIPGLIITCVMMVLGLGIFVYDIRHMIVPPVMSFPFVILSLIIAFSPMLAGEGIAMFAWPGWRDAFAGLFLSVPFLLLWIVSRGRWLGFGDIVLMLGMGWWLGLWDGLFALMLSFWIGTIVILGYMGVVHILRFSGLVKNTKSRILSKEIPFAPFLIIGTLLVYFTGISLSTILPYVVI